MALYIIYMGIQLPRPGLFHILHMTLQISLKNIQLYDPLTEKFLTDNKRKFSDMMTNI